MQAARYELTFSIQPPIDDVWAIDISKLCHLLSESADEYDARADWRMVSCGYEDAAREITATGRNARTF